MKMKESTYTFVSVSTAKQGMLDELIEIAKGPTQKMDDKVPGLIAYQVSVDKDRNSVIVWATFDTKETLYDFLKTSQGKDDHGENDSMESIATFQMYDCEPVSARLDPK
jgi:heme-degrading monooxygenase HmoA